MNDDPERRSKWPARSRNALYRDAAERKRRERYALVQQLAKDSPELPLREIATRAGTNLTTVRKILGRTGQYGDPLSNREKQVLQLIANGLKAPEIAAELYISYSTVRTHGESIRKKLGAKNWAHAVYLAREELLNG